MAKLVGPLKLKGSVDGLNFRVMKDGECIAGRKPGPSSKMVKEHRRFQRTRENSREFIRAQSAATLLRRALMPQWKEAADPKSFRRLHAIMVRILHKDTVNARGGRVLTHRALKLLEGFDFNERSPLTAALRVPLNSSIDRSAGRIDLKLPSFIPSARITQHVGATHAKLMIKGFALDFLNNEVLQIATEAIVIPINDEETEPCNLKATFIAEQTMPLFLCAGLSYWQKDALGDLIPLSKKEKNALALLHVNSKEESYDS